MDAISLLSGIMIGAGLGLSFCTAILYVHHKEVLLNKVNPALNRNLDDKEKDLEK